MSTALRFHPLEIVLSMVWKAAIVVALGAPVWAVLVFEVVLNGAAMFNHANARLSDGLDRALRLVIVTPDMHRTHHSVVRAEMDSNYGFNLSWWDRMLSTYRHDPAAGEGGVVIGLEEFRSKPPGRSSHSSRSPSARSDDIMTTPRFPAPASAGPDR